MAPCVRETHRLRAWILARSRPSTHARAASGTTPHGPGRCTSTPDSGRGDQRSPRWGPRRRRREPVRHPREELPVLEQVTRSVYHFVSSSALLLSITDDARIGSSSNNRWYYRPPSIQSREPAKPQHTTAPSDPAASSRGNRAYGRPSARPHGRGHSRRGAIPQRAIAYGPCEPPECSIPPLLVRVHNRLLRPCGGPPNYSFALSLTCAQPASRGCTSDSARALHWGNRATEQR